MASCLSNKSCALDYYNNTVASPANYTTKHSSKVKILDM